MTFSILICKKERLYYFNFAAALNRGEMRWRRVNEQKKYEGRNKYFGVSPKALKVSWLKLNQNKKGKMQNRTKSIGDKMERRRENKNYWNANFDGWKRWILVFLWCSANMGRLQYNVNNCCYVNWLPLHHSPPCSDTLCWWPINHFTLYSY